MVPDACASLDVEVCSEQPRLAASDEAGSRTLPLELNPAFHVDCA